MNFKLFYVLGSFQSELLLQCCFLKLFFLLLSLTMFLNLKTHVHLRQKMKNIKLMF